MSERETFAQWEKRMRMHKEHRWISTELNEKGGVVRAYCSDDEWSENEELDNDR